MFSNRLSVGVAMAVGICGGAGQLAAQNRMTLVCQPTTTDVPRFVLDVDLMNRTVHWRARRSTYPATFTATSVRFRETDTGYTKIHWEIDRTTGDMYSVGHPGIVQAICQPSGGF